MASSLRDELLAGMRGAAQPPEHPTIVQSGDRAGFESLRLVRREEPNFSELVLQQYRLLHRLLTLESSNEARVEKCKKLIRLLQAREAVQVEKLLKSRLLLPAGENQRLKRETEALLRKYEHLTGEH